MSSACQQVLLIPELLEAIILELPIRDIFRAQSVSTIWHDVIGTSPTIQEKLFIKPSSAPVVPTGPKRTSTCTLLAWRDMIHYPHHFDINNHFLNRIDGTIRVPKDTRRVPKGGISYWSPAMSKLPREVTMTRVMLDGLEHGSPIMATKDARNHSWEALGQAFITQPPCTTARFRVIVGDRPTVKECSLLNREGLKHDDIWKVARGVLAGTEYAHGKCSVKITVTVLMVMSDAEAEEWEEDWRRQVQA